MANGDTMIPSSCRALPKAHLQCYLNICQADAWNTDALAPTALTMSES